jgi:nicotinate-nucleotide adenylyltransferase
MSAPAKVGLYFGSFNPVHMGHLVIANHMAHYTDLDAVWFVVTPQSPQKAKNALIAFEHRLQMIRLALADNPVLSATDVEAHLPEPHYTGATLRRLRADFPEVAFSVIIGEDNFDALHTWKDFEELLNHHRVLVYPRRSPDAPVPPETQCNQAATQHLHANVEHCDAPMISISSTYLRQAILANKDIRYLLPDKVLNYIGNNHLYEG